MEKKQLPDDFKDFIQCLNSNNVRYLLVGGWTVGLYGNPKIASGRNIDLFDTEKLEKKKVSKKIKSI